VALDEGALDEALRLLTDLLPLLRSGPMSGEEVYALAWLAAIHLARGENAEALAAVKWRWMVLPTQN